MGPGQYNSCFFPRDRESGNIQGAMLHWTDFVPQIPTDGYFISRFANATYHFPRDMLVAFGLFWLFHVQFHLMPCGQKFKEFAVNPLKHT